MGKTKQKESPAVEMQKRMRKNISKSYLLEWNEFKRKQRQTKGLTSKK